MTSQPGWHPDPVPAEPGQPPRLRYWDGTRWTEHTQPSPVSSSGPAPYAGTYGAAYSTHSAYSTGAGSPYAAAGPATTPDGVPLAGWWARVLALVVDGVILAIIGALVALPWVREVWHTYRDWFDTAIDSSSNGGTVDTGQLRSDLTRPLLVIGLINLGLNFVYHVGFLTWLQATPGKLVLGLRVRLRERPELPVGAVLLRWLGQHGPGVLALIPLVGYLTWIYSLLDYLWPLWDPHKQAVHDKIAKTNVVRVR